MSATAKMLLRHLTLAKCNWKTANILHQMKRKENNFLVWLCFTGRCSGQAQPRDVTAQQKACARRRKINLPAKFALFSSVEKSSHKMTTLPVPDDMQSRAKRATTKTDLPAGCSRKSFPSSCQSCRVQTVFKGQPWQLHDYRGHSVIACFKKKTTKKTSPPTSSHWHHPFRCWSPDSTSTGQRNFVYVSVNSCLLVIQSDATAWK